MISLFSFFLSLLFLVSILVAVSRLLYRPQVHVLGAPSILGLPIVGNAFQLYHNPALTLSNWAQAVLLPVLLVHLGRMPVVVVSNFRMVRELYANHSVGLSSRPLLHTFHTVVSAVQGVTVGSTPAGASFRRKKKCLSMQLSNVALHQSLVNAAVDHHSRMALKHLLKFRLQVGCDCRTPLNDVSMLLHAQHFVLGVAIDITYGMTMDCEKADSELAASIIATENQIIRTRALFANYQDYLPLLSRWPLSWIFSSKPQFWRDRRDAYMRRLYNDFEHRLLMNDPQAVRSMLGRILSNPKVSISASEIQSICLTMVSAGLDNSALTFDHLIGQLSHQHGYAMQEKLYSSLINLYDGDMVVAWHQVAISTDCNYALALISEAMRYFTVLPLGLPRLTTKKIICNGVTIPENTVVVMNAFAANHDPAQFHNPNEFNPDRWLNEDEIINTKMSHLTFGLGSRKCSGDRLAIRDLYTMLCRTILLFEVRRPADGKYHMKLNPFEGNLCPTATSFEPTEFRVWLRPREGPQVPELHAIVLR